MIADHNDINAIQRKYTETVAAQGAMVPAIALARQVIDYDPDRRKNLLALYMRNAMSGDREMSAAKAEIIARANPQYLEGLDKLAEELCNAYEVRAKWDALIARLDAARSLLAVSRETLRQMPEAT